MTLHPPRNQSLQDSRGGPLAQAGEYQQAAAIATQAEAVARSGTGHGPQAKALAKVAGALAQAGENRSAAHMAAALCVNEDWMTALTPVLMLVPSACTTLARILEGQ